MMYETNEYVKGNPLLSKEIISKYDLKQTRDVIIQTLDQLEEWKYAFLNLIPPKITPNYEIRYEMPNFNKKIDKVGDYVEAKSELENKIINIHFNLNQVLSNFNHIEVMYYDMYYIKRNTEAAIEERLNIGHTFGKHIRDSLTLKLALGLGKAIHK